MNSRDTFQIHTRHHHHHHHQGYHRHHNNRYCHNCRCHRDHQGHVGTKRQKTNDDEVEKTFSHASYKFEGSFALMNVMISRELDSDQLLNIHAGGARGSLKITQSGRSLTRPLAPKGKVNEPPLRAACRGPGCLAASNSSDGDAQPEHPFLTPSLPYHVPISSQGLAP